jgi:hypothetical protein
MVRRVDYFCRYRVSTAASVSLQRQDRGRLPALRSPAPNDKEDAMKIIDIALIGSALLASGAAAAQDSPSATRRVDASQYYGLYSPPSQGVAALANFDRSGTSGREGYGEDPLYPEGPGNVAN